MESTLAFAELYGEVANTLIYLRIKNIFVSCITMVWTLLLWGFCLKKASGFVFLVEGARDRGFKGKYLLYLLSI